MVKMCTTICFCKMPVQTHDACNKTVYHYMHVEAMSIQMHAVTDKQENNMKLHNLVVSTAIQLQILQKMLTCKATMEQQKDQVKAFI